MLDFISTITFFAVLGIVAFAFYNWLEKIELEKEYLQNLVNEQEKNKNTLRKKI